MTHATPEDYDRFENSGAAAEAHNAIADQRQEHQQRHDDFEDTRQQLEGTDAGEADVDGTVQNGAGFRMTDDRRVGVASLPVDGHGSIAFGKPSGRAGSELLGQIEAMEDEQASLTDLTGFVWPTLGNWCLNGNRGADWWADEVALMDAVELVRSVAVGGNR